MQRPSFFSRVQDLLAKPFGAALFGALIVLIVGAIAVEAGWIGKEQRTVVNQSAVTTPTANDGGALTVNQIYKKDGPGVVFIRSQIETQVESPFGLPQRQSGEATGSGFVVDKQGHIATNAHVVEGASKITVGFGESRVVNAKLVGKDTSNDVALLKVNVDQNTLDPLTLGDSTKAQVGDPVVAIGNPFGLDRTVTTGIVSALARQIKAPNGFTIQNVIQTDAAINPGNSGGPLIDGQGRVLGINSQIATTGGGNVGIGFAVPVNTAKDIINQLKKSGKVERAFLGVTGLTISPQLADSLNLPANKGVLVQDATGPAKSAGVKGGDTPVTINGEQLQLGGDVIVQIDDKQVESMTDVVSKVDSKKPGDEVTLKLLRGSKGRTVKVKLGKRPDNINANKGGQSSPNGQGSPTPIP